MRKGPSIAQCTLDARARQVGWYQIETYYLASGCLLHGDSLFFTQRNTLQWMQGCCLIRIWRFLLLLIGGEQEKHYV